MLVHPCTWCRKITDKTHSQSNYTSDICIKGPGFSEKPCKSSTTNTIPEPGISDHVNRRKSYEFSLQNDGKFHGENEDEYLKSHHIKVDKVKSNIPVHITNTCFSKSHDILNVKPQYSHLYGNLTTIKRSNKAVQALDLPTVININPRSLNNKIEAFKTYMEEEEVDLAIISESHEQEDKLLVNNFQMENFQVISNVHQRRGKGGRPALVVNNAKYQVQNVTNTLINIPWGVEAVWAVLTPHKVTNDSDIQRIAVCSFYNCNKRSKFKTTLLNHIEEAFNILSIKYTKGLHFILGADANHLKLDRILSLRQDMRSLVEDFTRLGPPPAMLDPIITTLGSYYQRPVCYPPPRC